MKGLVPIPRAAILGPVLLLLAFTADPSPAASPSVHPALLHVEPGVPVHERFLTRDSSGRMLLQLIVEGDVAPGALSARGIEVGTAVGRFRTVRCPLGQLPDLLATPGIERVTPAERCEPLLDLSAVDTDATSVRGVPPPAFTGQTGAGILVGIVDSGIDYPHGDFRNPDGSTRLVSIWDQTDTGGTPPSGYTYGSEWSTAAINNGTAGERDVSGHGTHVMGIAGGDGSATGNGLPEFRYVGMAPEADLCVVKTTFQTTDIADGVAYIFAKATTLGKKAVINLSLGTQDGPHDGTYALGTLVGALTGPGRIVVASAGNSGEDDLHGQLVLGGAAPDTMTLVVPTYARNGGAGNDYLLFSGWYEGADQVSLTIVSPGGTTLGPVPPGASLTGRNTADGYLNIYNGTTTPSNGDHQIYIELFDGFANKPPKSGTWQFIFTPISLGGNGQVDMYLYADQLGNGAALARWTRGLLAGGVVGSPGDGDSLICVGAHTTKDCWDAVDGLHYCWNPRPPLGEIASFSSQGPRRDGVRKPDLVAPGFGVTSSKSADYAPPTPLIATDGVHHNEAGTSMSAPHVTGAVALLLAQQSWENATPSEIRARLESTATSDAATGVVPNNAYGAGKLDIGSALGPITAVEMLPGAPRPRVALEANAPNPFNPSTAIRFETPGPGAVFLRIYSADGKLVRTLARGKLPAGRYRASWDGRDEHGAQAASGIYVYELDAVGERLSRKMTLLK